MPTIINDGNCSLVPTPHAGGERVKVAWYL